MTEWSSMVVFLGFAIFVLMPLIARFFFKNSFWTHVKSRDNLSSSEWRTRFASELATADFEDLASVLQIFCKPTAANWTQLRPDDSIGPNSYPSFFMVESVWEEISDVIAVKHPKFLDIVNKIWHHDCDKFVVNDLIRELGS